MNSAPKYHKSRNGVISRLYSRQKSNAKKRKMDMPSYTKKEFEEWLLTTLFDELFNMWVDSNYDTKVKPSVNRIDDLRSYSLDNIEIITWGENRSSSHLDRKMGRGRSGLSRCKKVIQYDMNMNYLNEFDSQSIASKQTGSNQVSISKCCRKILNHTNGFRFTFKE